jgi:hypothetical protein
MAVFRTMKKCNPFLQKEGKTVNSDRVSESVIYGIKAGSLIFYF